MIHSLYNKFQMIHLKIYLQIYTIGFYILIHPIVISLSLKQLIIILVVNKKYKMII